MTHPGIEEKGCATSVLRIAFAGQRLPEPAGACAWMLVDGARQDLPLRLDLYQHSRDGFEWGYEGSGPAQLALAICAQLVDADTALYVHQAVKTTLIARIPRECQWTLTERQVRDAIAKALDARRHQALGR